MCIYICIYMYIYVYIYIYLYIYVSALYLYARSSFDVVVDELRRTFGSILVSTFQPATSGELSQKALVITPLKEKKKTGNGRQKELQTENIKP